MSRRTTGFTFIELLMVGSVVFVLLGGIMLVLSEVGAQVWNRTEVQQVSLDDAQRALDLQSLAPVQPGEKGESKGGGNS